MELPRCYLCLREIDPDQNSFIVAGRAGLAYQHASPWQCIFRMVR